MHLLLVRVSHASGVSTINREFGKRLSSSLGGNREFRAMVGGPILYLHYKNERWMEL